MTMMMKYNQYIVRKISVIQCNDEIGICNDAVNIVLISQQITSDDKIDITLNRCIMNNDKESPKE